jgi:hypothetical protein
MERRTVIGIVVLMLAALVAWVISCGGGGSGSGTFDGSINIGNKGKGITLTGEQVWSMVYTVTYDVGRFGGPFGSLSLNLEENLSGVTFTPTGVPAGLIPLADPDTGILTLRVAPAEAASTVCTDGELIGPFTITLDGSFQPVSVVPPTVEATQTTMDVINIGSYSICFEVTSPVDAVADLNRVEFEITQCGEVPADMAGAWAGSFTCVSNCDGESGSVELTIVQEAGNLSAASYSDDEATYDGSICGNRFSYKGGDGESYKESGTFVMEPDGVHATKTSSYRSLDGICWGDCTDDLMRLE